MKWHRRFLELAKLISSWSKDPSTKVGCVIVGPDREIRSTGFNGFPRGVKDDDRLEDRAKKYPIIVHAEENSIMHAARIGLSLKGCTAYVTWPPCTRCARSLIQAGISTVVFEKTEIPERWKDDFEKSMDLLLEAGVEFIEYIEMDSVLSSPIESLDTKRPSAVEILRGFGIETVGDLVRRSESDLLAIRGIGEISIMIMNNSLRDFGLRIGMYSE